MTASIMPMQIEILPERFWQPRIAAVDCHAGTARLRGFLMAIHGRHAGLTPPAAASILDDQTSLLALPRRPWGPWEAMRSHVRRAINAASDPGDRFWAEVSPALLYSRVLVPVVHAVSQRIGHSCLFGNASSKPAGAVMRSAGDYENYQRRFEETLAGFLSEPAWMGTAFWDGAAFSLWSEFLLRSGSRALEMKPHDPVPDTDPGIIHWLRRLNPAFSGDTPRRRPRVVHHRINPLQPRPRQGGVTGVRLSNTPDDFGDRLVSEAVYPSILQLDRLLHSGYLVRHRPPPLDRRRDILVLGLFPGSRLKAGYSLAGAAWLDAALRAAILLRRAGLARSDIAAAAWAAGGGANVAQVSIERLEWLDAADPWTAGVDERLAFLRTAGWLPGFVDRGPGVALAPAGGAGAGYDGCLPGGMADWLRRVVEAKPFLRAARQEDRVRLLAQYSAVHVQIIVQDTAEPETSAASRGFLHRIRSDLGLHGDGHSVAMVRVSRRPFGSFSVHTELRPAAVMHEADGTTDADQFTGALVRSMIDCMLGMPDG